MISGFMGVGGGWLVVTFALSSRWLLVCVGASRPVGAGVSGNPVGLACQAGSFGFGVAWIGGQDGLAVDGLSATRRLWVVGRGAVLGIALLSVVSRGDRFGRWEGVSVWWGVGEWTKGDRGGGGCSQTLRGGRGGGVGRKGVPGGHAVEDWILVLGGITLVEGCRAGAARAGYGGGTWLPPVSCTGSGVGGGCMDCSGMLGWWFRVVGSALGGLGCVGGAGFVGGVSWVGLGFGGQRRERRGRLLGMKYSDGIEHGRVRGGMCFIGGGIGNSGESSKAESLALEVSLLCDINITNMTIAVEDIMHYLMVTVASSDDPCPSVVFFDVVVAFVGFAHLERENGGSCDGRGGKGGSMSMISGTGGGWLAKCSMESNVMIAWKVEWEPETVWLVEEVLSSELLGVHLERTLVELKEWHIVDQEMAENGDEEAMEKAGSLLEGIRPLISKGSEYLFNRNEENLRKVKAMQRAF
ncbi:hypothetical protein Tco_0418274 [Tanacetum coccineum]